MTEPAWCVVVVRAWREAGVTRVRLLCSGTAGRESHVTTSGQDVCDWLDRWLSALEKPPDQGVDDRRDAGGTWR